MGLEFIVTKKETKRIKLKIDKMKSPQIFILLFPGDWNSFNLRSQI